MLLTEEIEIFVRPRTVNHFKEKGYDIPVIYDENSKKELYDFNAKIKVKIDDLPASSHLKIKYRCDNCNEIFETTYHAWNHRKYKELGDLCKKCAAKIKLPQAMVDNYGYNNPIYVPSIIEKKKQTNIEKYGTEWAISSSIVRERSKQTMIERLGVDSSMKSEEVKEKARITNNIRYGGNAPTCSEEVLLKIQQTCIIRYGVSNPAKVQKFKEKARKTLYKNNNIPSSKAEEKFCEILKDIYGEENCVPGFPEGAYSLDCLVTINNIKIDFEYDGRYWHENRKQKDGARNAILMNLGYRIVRVKGNNKDTMPSKEQIIQAVDYLLKENHHLVFIDMNN